MYAKYFGLYVGQPQASQHKNLTKKDVNKIYEDFLTAAIIYNVKT